MKPVRISMVALGICAAIGCASVGGKCLSESSIRDVLTAHSDPSDDGGCVVVVDLENGAVVQSVAVGGVTAKDTYEVGSVIEPLTVGIALNKGIAKMDTLFSTDCNRVKYPNLPNDGNHKWDTQMSVADALVQSSNIVIGKLGADVGLDALTDGLWRFGITPPTDGIACRMAVGHGVSASVEQIAKAYAVLANHGREPWGEKRQIVKAEVADAVCKELERVTSNEGTARRAAVDGVRTAGKTGTAMRKVGGAYVADKFNATFAGFVPSDAPRSVVVVRYATGVCQMHLGGQRPAEAFADIVRVIAE